MATGGENHSDDMGSEDFCDVVCDPCQENGELHKAVGMCIDCKDYLCQKCFDVHKISRTSRKHELLDKETMLQRQRSQVSLTEDTCTGQCAVHDNKVIEYYCINHSHFSCSDCIKLDHKTCGVNVRHIPHEAKDLTHNEEYQQVESQLASVVARSNKVTEDNKQKTESIKKNCSEAVHMMRKFRKEINESLDKIEANLARQCETIKSEVTANITKIADSNKSIQRELCALMTAKETYETKQQNCALYTHMMRTKNKLKLSEETVKQAEKELSHINSQIKFVANQENLNSLKLPESFGKLLTPETATPEIKETPVRQEEQTTSVKRVVTKRIVRSEYIKDIKVRYKTDKNNCDITGLVALPGNRLILADHYYNGNVKLVDVQHDQIIKCLVLSSKPFDVAMVTDCQVAITIPNDKKIAMISVTATSMTEDRKLDVDGNCHGVDYRDGKLAVSFFYPPGIQVLTLQGNVLYNITRDQQGHCLFNTPYYIAFGQDSDSLYVSNYQSDNVVHVKFDGTVVDTYTDRELMWPRTLLIDSNGHVCVCGDGSSNIHQLTPDCRKVRVLLTEADGVYRPRSISYSETERRLYVGMCWNDVVKVYSK